MKLDEIAAEASKLPEEERAALASRLIHGLETPVYDVSDQQVFQRIIEAEADATVMISFDELVSGFLQDDEPQNSKSRVNRLGCRGRMAPGA